VGILNSKLPFSVKTGSVGGVSKGVKEFQNEKGQLPSSAEEGWMRD